MALLAKPCNATIMIRADKVEKFEAYAKKIAIDSGHMKKCLEISNRKK